MFLSLCFFSTYTLYWVDLFGLLIGSLITIVIIFFGTVMAMIFIERVEQ